MAPKRKRQTTLQSNGLKSGEPLQRQNLAGREFASWSWVGNEVTSVSGITNAHQLAAYGFGSLGTRSTCPNKYTQPTEALVKPLDNDEPDTEVITVVSDDDVPISCDKRRCRANPYCLSYLGQDKWEKTEVAKRAFMKGVDLGENPVISSREPGLPVGLQNLGATCYANAFLQVWFQNPKFRSGVYSCEADKASPIFHLQVVFAALQELETHAFNPIQLVESLQIRASEQQDAQEFAKLFMSHLDSEFRKQKDPLTASLVPDQFQGQQVYGTLCHGCQSSSEQSSDFLELEVSLEPNSSLEDRLEALLTEETLMGDNQYQCANCGGLRDATRYSELRKLPPVLHISLMRFVFDFNTLERKKSKHAMSFPTSIDMARFIRSRKKGETQVPAAKQPYKLHGILLHKGASAYHGHYEAQVLNLENGTWYQFNDEVVTKLKMPALSSNGTNSKDVGTSNGSDPPNKTATNGLPSRMTSKDAYMLIFVRSDSSQAGAEGSTSLNGTHATVAPPPDAVLEVQKLNEAHQKACADFDLRESEVKQQFDHLRNDIMNIYQQWDVADDPEAVVFSREALETWLSAPLCASRKAKLSPPPTDTQTQNGSDVVMASANDASPNPNTASGTDTKHQASPNPEISVASIVCTHGKLDPRKASEMKCIRKAAYDEMVEQTYVTFAPKPLLEHDVCATCVAEVFQERFHGSEHSRTVNEFFDVIDDDLDQVESGFWISKAWLKDWKTVHPKIPVFADRLHPDHPDHGESIVCEHGGLTPQTTGRRRISAEAVCLIQTEFPDWQPLSAELDACAVCNAEANLSRAEKRDVRRAAEEEKLRLKRTYDQVLSEIASGIPSITDNVQYAMVPAAFLRSWKLWLSRPTGTERPTGINTDAYLCEHKKLVVNPNVRQDVDGTVMFVVVDDWRIFEELYSAGPLLSASHVTTVDDNGTQQRTWVHDIDVCEDCRTQRKTDYESTEVTVLLKDADAKDKAPSKSTGGRQSRRLRDVKTKGVRRRFPITKSTTVKDLKVAIQAALNIPTIAQKLSLRGAPLDDGGASLGALGVFAHELFELEEVHEDYDVLACTDEDDAAAVAPAGKRRRRDEGAAFGGTLLAGGSLPVLAPAPATVPPPSSSPPPSARACGACTFDNAPADTVCAMCGTPLAVG